VAETYPTEMYRHLGVRFPPSRGGARSGKRVQAARAGNGDALLAWVAAAGVVLDPAAETALRDGFGAGAAAEDQFDATVGLLGMLNIVLGRASSGEPDDPITRDVEGWILGAGMPAAAQSN
jgi:hypothetical protein